MNQFSTLQSEPVRVPLRVDDVELLNAAGAFADYRKVELIEGELLYMNAQFRPHMHAKDELAYRLRRALEAIGSDLFVGTEATVRLSDYDLPEPDILVTSEPHGDGPVPGGSVHMLIEVADTTLDNDLGRKQAIYAQAAIPEYWVVDVQGKIIHQLWSPSGSRFAERREIPFGQPLTAIAIPGLTVATDRL